MDEVKTTPKAAPADNRLPDTNMSIDVVPLRGWFEMPDSVDPRDRGQLEYIRRQFAPDVSPMDMLKEIKEIERKLPTPLLGETRLGKVYNYLRAIEDVTRAKEKRDLLLA